MLLLTNLWAKDLGEARVFAGAFPRGAFRQGAGRRSLLVLVASPRKVAGHPRHCLSSALGGDILSATGAINE